MLLLVRGFSVSVFFFWEGGGGVDLTVCLRVSVCLTVFCRSVCVQAVALVRAAITSGIENDLGSGSNVDITVSRPPSNPKPQTYEPQNPDP